MAVEIVDFPINSMVIFHSYVTNYQRVYMLTWLGYIDGIHGAPYIAAPWIRHGIGCFLGDESWATQNG